MVAGCRRSEPGCGNNDRPEAIASKLRADAPDYNAPASGGSSSLPRGIESWWASRFRFKHPMPLFMRAIVFGVPPAGKLNFNAQSNEPRAQAGQAARSGRAKRTAIIHAQGAGLSLSFKQVDKGLLRQDKPLTWQHLRQQPKAAHHIADR